MIYIWWWPVWQMGYPAYVVKNNHTGKKKVVHQVRLLLWLTDYGEPVRRNLMDISVMPPGTVMDQYPLEGCESDNLVPGCSCSMAWT